MRFLEEVEMSAENFAELVAASADDLAIVANMKEYLAEKDEEKKENG